MRRVLPHLMLMLAIPIAGCAAQAAGSAQLAGSNWRFVTIDGEAPISRAAKLTFDDGRIGANVGCNAMGGEWRIEDGRLIAGPLMQTRMFCEGKLGEQEQAIGALLVAAPELALDEARLELRSHGHSARLERL
jgi:heat shock protein HslJ